MKNLVLFIATILLYCGNVSGQDINTALKGNTLTIDVPAEVYATADIHDVVFNASIHDVVFNASIHDVVFNANIHDVVFNYAQPLDVTIHTMDGRQVYSEKLEATNGLIITIDAQHLPEASYVLYLRTGNGQTFTGEFVKS